MALVMGVDPASKAEMANFTVIAVRSENGAWARVMWDKLGWVIILSDYGHWAYRWTHIGKQTIPEFLAQTECDYLCGKFLGNDRYEYDKDASVKSIREAILEFRKDGLLDKEEAAAEWELVTDLASGDVTFEDWANSSDLGDTYEYRMTKMNETWGYFWTRLWEPLVLPILKAEA